VCEAFLHLLILFKYSFKATGLQWNLHGCERHKKKTARYAAVAAYAAVDVCMHCKNGVKKR